MRARTRVEEDGGQICLSKRREREREREMEMYGRTREFDAGPRLFTRLFCVFARARRIITLAAEREAHGGESMGELFRWSFIF